ncbi:hypothetical protein BBW65_06890 [Helicobacter enhydrae]|uniref:Uncharacterized protein n=1 Tax=Helicobacter enhydrae TaxID=222136 RepID=A0A1B1U719_9HELI|nr:hypothetical protein [Helicobacter enhydrae]ANV98536.1 hypothetical protein BBW65_06890 [Helicobacter enhydrae]
MATLPIEQERQEHFQQMQDKKQTMQECQAKQQQTSCLTCKEAPRCKIREEYVQAVYLFLNEGQNADFSF